MTQLNPTLNSFPIHPETALVLLGHGSTKNPDSEKPVCQHAAELRKRGSFMEVREAFWKQEPRVDTVLGELGAANVVIVPMFISEGYFCEEVIPSALGFGPRTAPGGPRCASRGGQQLFYTRPLGTHEAMTKILLKRARETLQKYPFPAQVAEEETTLFVAGHGTGQNAESRLSIDRQVERLRHQAKFAAVHAVFMDEPPSIADCYAMASTQNIVMVPFFISDGLHVAEDIPVLLGEPKVRVQERLQAGRSTWRNPTERHGKRLWYAPSVGTDPDLANVILEIARETLTPKPH